MITETVFLLPAAAAGIALLHTILGPDHFLPFAAMAEARGWTNRRMLLVTGACGLAHLGSSIVLAFIAASLGWSLTTLAGIEGLRGDLAAWLLLGFGVAYAAWGFKRAQRARAHDHPHAHADGTVHTHLHAHAREHLHVHPRPAMGSFAAWSLFVIFLFGPCEPLIPLLLVPAAQGDYLTLALVIGVFSVVTIGAMLAGVWALRAGWRKVARPGWQQHVPVAAGSTIALCGVAMLLGL
jgi:nickel/cobalt transporter (NicO) family protein